MTGMEGKLFNPLAFTKTFVLLASVVIALAIIPAVAHLLLAGRPGTAGSEARAANWVAGFWVLG
jgi:Cu/Ag efflux pump CusA